MKSESLGLMFSFMKDPVRFGSLSPVGFFLCHSFALTSDWCVHDYVCVCVCVVCTRQSSSGLKPDRFELIRSQCCCWLGEINGAAFYQMQLHDSCGNKVLLGAS